MKEKERLNNMQRRKFIKTTASAAIISTVASAPVLGREFCTVSGSMSGNMSNANINAKDAQCATYRGKTADQYIEEMTGNRTSYYDADGNHVINNDGSLNLNGFDLFETDTLWGIFGFDSIYPSTYSNIPVASDQTLGWIFSNYIDIIHIQHHLIREIFTSFFNSVNYPDYYPYNPTNVLELYNEHRYQPDNYVNIVIDALRNLNQGA